MTVARSHRRSSTVSLWTGGDDLAQARAAFDGFLEAIRRHRVALLVWVALCLVVAGVYARSTTPEYLASVQLVLRGGHKAQDEPDDTSLSHQFELSGAEIETQLAVVRSSGLLQPVFDTLRLDAAPELTNAVAAPAGRRWAAARNIQRRHDLFTAFRSRVGARRVGLSATFEVSYRAPDPAQAVRVANAIAAAYVHDRIRTAMVDTRAFTPYLTTRIAAIITQEALASEAVRKGGLPDAEFVDADVRLLGPARMPLAPAYPRLGPIGVFAAGFGLISGLLVIAVMHRLDGTIRSRAQLRHGFGIEALGFAMEDGQAAPQAALVILAAVASRLVRPDADAMQGDGKARRHAIGIGSWENGPASRVIGTGLAEVLRSAGMSATVVDPDGPPEQAGAAAVVEGVAASLALPQEGIAVVILPAFSPSLAAQAVLPLLDAVLLVALAGHTTTAALRNTLRAAGGGRATPVAGVILVEASRAGGGKPGRSWRAPPRLTIGATQNNTL